MDPLLRLSELSVVRRGTRVVQGLDLEIRPGRVFWIVGPNGAGKSSLLRVMAGLDAPGHGRVHRRPPTVRFLYFHSEMALPPASTVGDWNRLVARVLPAGAAGGRTALWPDVGPDRKVGRLSTGERKRLLLDALLRRPGPLLLDEPYEHLSPDAKRDLTTLLEARARSTIVVVATNQSVQRAEKDGGLHIEGGVVRRIDPRPEVVHESA